MSFTAVYHKKKKKSVQCTTPFMLYRRPVPGTANHNASCIKYPPRHQPYHKDSPNIHVYQIRSPDIVSLLCLISNLHFLNIGNLEPAWVERMSESLPLPSLSPLDHRNMTLAGEFPPRQKKKKKKKR